MKKCLCYCSDRQGTVAANSLHLSSSSFGRRKVENQKHPNPIIYFLNKPSATWRARRKHKFSLQNQQENNRFGCGGTTKGMSECLKGGVDTFSTITPSNNYFPINFLVALVGMLIILPKTSKKEASKLWFSL